MSVLGLVSAAILAAHAKPPEPRGLAAPNREPLLSIRLAGSGIGGGWVPSGETDTLATEDPMEPTLIVARAPVATDEMLVCAAAISDKYGYPALLLRFNSDGARRLATATRKHKGAGRLAVVVDRRIVTAPHISGEAGGDGRMVVHGPSADQAQELVAYLMHRVPGLAKCEAD